GDGGGSHGRGGAGEHGGAACGVCRPGDRQAGRGHLERAREGGRCVTAGEPRVSIIIPAYNEGKRIVPVLDRLFESVNLSCEVLVVVDDESDTTVPVVRDYAQAEPRLR